jgi:hypothetical protein
MDDKKSGNAYVGCVSANSELKNGAATGRSKFVIPAKAGIHSKYEALGKNRRHMLSNAQHSKWIPTFAGMTSIGFLVTGTASSSEHL